MPKPVAFKDYPITSEMTADRVWQDILRHLIGQVSVEIVEKSSPTSTAKLWYRVWFMQRTDNSNHADADPKGDY